MCSNFRWRRQWHPTPVLLPGKSHGRRSLVGCSPWGPSESDTTERLHFHFSLSCTGEGNGNPLQCSCLENPRDGGAWWAAVSEVTQSRTRLKQLSSNFRTLGYAGTRKVFTLPSISSYRTSALRRETCLCNEGVKTTVLSAWSNRPGAKRCTRWDPKMRVPVEDKPRSLCRPSCECSRQTSCAPERQHEKILLQHDLVLNWLFPANIHSGIFL